MISCYFAFCEEAQHVFPQLAVVTLDRKIFHVK